MRTSPAARRRPLRRLAAAALAAALALLAAPVPAAPLAAARALTAPAAAALPSGFHAAGPLRLLDTRLDAAGPLAGGSTRDLAVSARAGLPVEAVAAVLNVTVTEPTAPSYVTVWPAGRSRPTTSNLNMVAGQTVANLVVVGLGAGGSVSLFNFSGTTHLVVDLTGWLDAAFTPATPQRLVDTRLGLGGPRLGPGEQRTLAVAGLAGIPAGASAVSLNVTVTEPTAAGYLTVWPSGSARPLASNLNMVAGQTVPNAVIVGLGGGRLDVFNLAGSTHLLVDVTGWFTGAIATFPPARAQDTRQSTCGRALGPGETRTLPISGLAGVPASGAGAVVLNVTATRATAPTYLTVWPTGTPKPATSSLNLPAGATVPNLVVTALGAGGQVDVFNLAGRVDVVVDATASFPGTTPGGSRAPCPGGPATVVWRGSTARPWVALTFDAGSDAGFTSTILDTLAAAHVTASFALTGRWAQANPALASRIGSAADVVLNHTDDHPSFTGASTGTAPLTAAQRRDQLDRAEVAIASATGRSTRPWFRPPYGDRDTSVDADVGAAGYRYEVMWTIDSLGWKGTPPAAVTDRVLSSLVPGAIVLLHVGSASTDAAALPGILAGITARGYTVVALPALLGVS